MEPYLSLIIPVYNVETFLSETLNSVVRQISLDNCIEVLLVNDGSTDSSGDICKKFAESNSNIKYIEKENGGVSETRNLGIKKAKGMYISFLDSDDLLSSGFITDIIKQIKNNEFDICIYEYEDMPQQQNSFRHIRSNRSILNISKEVTGIDVITKMARQNVHISNIWSCIYRKEFLLKNSILFDNTLIASEDYDFILACFQKASSVIYSPQVSVIYRRYREGSATNTYSFKHLMSDIEVRIKWFNFAMDDNLIEFRTFVANDYVYLICQLVLMDWNVILKAKETIMNNIEIFKYSESKKALILRKLLYLFGFKNTMYILRITHIA